MRMKSTGEEVHTGDDGEEEDDGGGVSDLAEAEVRLADLSAAWLGMTR